MGTQSYTGGGEKSIGILLHIMRWEAIRERGMAPREVAYAMMGLKYTETAEAA